MAGRKPLAQEIKAQKGTLRNHRINKDAPKAVDGDMVFPANLPSGAEKYFEHFKMRMVELGLDSPSYADVLGLAALRRYQMDELLTEIGISGGYVIDDMNSKGIEIKKAHPAAILLNDVMRHYHSLLSELGLTPSAIQKVSAKGKKQDNPFGAFQ